MHRLVDGHRSAGRWALSPGLRAEAGGSNLTRLSPYLPRGETVSQPYDAPAPTSPVPPAGYGPQPGYAAPPVYGPPPGHGAPPAYGPPPGHGGPPGYGPQQGFGPPPA